MRILKSIFAYIFLYSPAFFAASDVLRPQDMSQGALGSGVIYDIKGKQEVGFKTGDLDPRYPLAIEVMLGWNTFLGGGGDDHGYGIAVDTEGNIYVSGTSSSTWGSPIRPFSGKHDAFVAKMNPDGILLWNTFLGGADDDEDYGIAVDPIGNVYVTGTSYKTWGSPIRPFSEWSDAFVAKLNTYGTLQWNTFLGGGRWNDGGGIAVDASANVYVTGFSDGTWGSPILPLMNGNAFVAKIDTRGTLLWNTFIPGESGDERTQGRSLALDASANVYITGDEHCCNFYWYSFIAKLDTYGTLQWRTHPTYPEVEKSDIGGEFLAVDASGNVYVIGEGYATSGFWMASVAKLDTYGTLKWNTFVSEETWTRGHGLAVDTSGNVYMTGASGGTWGLPIRNYADGGDAFVAALDPSGKLLWNAFLGGPSDDYGQGLAVDASVNVYVTGSSAESWGSPIRPFFGGSDGFVAKIKAGHYLTIASGPNGTTNPTPGTYSYDVGSAASVSAIADNGYVFDKWTGNVPAGQETSAIVSILMNADKSIKANFKAGYYLTISSDPHGTTNPAPGTYVYNLGSTASVSAIADNGYVFDRWTGDVPAGQETSATVSILMNATKSIQANFKKLYLLIISSGLHGTTNPAPGRYLHKEGSSVSVSAIADGDSVFMNWTGDVPAGQETSAIVSILMDADKSILANFKLVNPPSNLTAVRLTNRSLTQTEYIVDLSWAENPDNAGLSITTYRVYRKEGDSWIKIADFSSDVLSYRVRNVPKAEQTFGVASVTDGGVESAKTTVVK